MMYISLSDAKAQCRVDHSDEDSYIILQIQAASSMVKNYLKGVDPYEPMRDSSDTPLYDSAGYAIKDIDLDDIRYEVKAATAILVQKLYDRTFDASPGYLPAEVVAILYPLRDPTLA